MVPISCRSGRLINACIRALAGSKRGEASEARIVFRSWEEDCLVLRWGVGREGGAVPQCLLTGFCFS